jgi:hypothetical protein
MQIFNASARHGRVAMLFATAILTAKNANFFPIKLCVLSVLGGDTHVTLGLRVSCKPNPAVEQHMKI